MRNPKALPAVVAVEQGTEGGWRWCAAKLAFNCCRSEFATNRMQLRHSNSQFECAASCELWSCCALTSRGASRGAVVVRRHTHTHRQCRPLVHTRATRATAQISRSTTGEPLATPTHIQSGILTNLCAALEHNDVCNEAIVPLFGKDAHHIPLCPTSHFSFFITIHLAPEKKVIAEAEAHRKYAYVLV